MAPTNQGRRVDQHVPVSDSTPATLPHWNAEKRELRIGSVLIKQFRRPAPVAELILQTFQEENWKTRIDDPLSPLAGAPEHRRLRNEVQSINRRLGNRILRFYMDGTGEGICWERITLPRGRQQQTRGTTRLK